MTIPKKRLLATTVAGLGAAAAFSVAAPAMTSVTSAQPAAHVTHSAAVVSAVPSMNCKPSAGSVSMVASTSALPACPFNV
jgi:hypothetical protein